MPADRFYINAELKGGESILIEGPEHHHLSHVMRLGKGEEVELVNGRGHFALGTIVEVSKKAAHVELLSTTYSEELTPRIRLAIPFLRLSKLEWIIEKGTELGAGAFLLYPAKFSEKEEFSPRQLERLHLLAISALKQSGRLYLPSIEILSDLTSVLVKESLCLFGDLRANAAIDLACLKADSILFISGPEKGFSNEELSLLETKAKSVRLSPHILRAETAPIAAVSILGSLLYTQS